MVKMNVTSHLNNKPEQPSWPMSKSREVFLWWFLASLLWGDGQISLNSRLILVSGMTAFSLISVFVFTHTFKTQVTLKNPSMRYQMAIPNPLGFIAWKSHQVKQIFHHNHLNKLWDPISSAKSYPAGYKSFFKGAVGLCSLPLNLLWDLLVGFFTHSSPKNLSFLSMFLETWLSTVRMLICLFNLFFPFSDSSCGIREQFLLAAIKETCKIQETKLTIVIVIKRKKKSNLKLVQVSCIC